MRVIQIDKISFRCRIDDAVPWIDEVEINGVWVNPEDYLASSVCESLDAALVDMLSIEREYDHD